MPNPDQTAHVVRQTQDLAKARLACAALREGRLLGSAPQAVLSLARRLLASLPLH